MKRLPGILAAATLAAAAAFALPPGGAVTEKPDITSRGGLRIGSVLIPWGNPAPIEIRGADATQSGPQACVFNATYEMTNLGNVPTAPAFTSRLRVDGMTVAATNSGLALSAHETKGVTTSPYLPIGSHSIELSLDDESAVAESRKDNNRLKALYVLKAPCGAAPAPGKK
jgi:hypothetical protein